MQEQIKPTATLATARVDRLIGRALAAGSILFALEGFANFYAQLPLQNGPIAWLVVSILWATTLAYVITFWFGSANYLYLRIHALYVAVIPILWIFCMNVNPDATGDFYPWLWWGMSTGWLAAALSFKLRWVVLYYLVVNFYTQYLFTTRLGGSHTIGTAILDGLYTLLSNSSVSVIALMLRHAATRSDRANSERIETAILEAQVEAQAKERARLDALVHDSVLTALISAGNANSLEESKASADLAIEAIAKLQTAGTTYAPTASILCSSLFDSVIAAAQRLDSEIEVKKTCLISFNVNGDVATALTEATLQAIQNSNLHAGKNAKRELHLKSTDGSLKIVVKDDGVGFRPNRIPRGRLGIKLSINRRMEAIGGIAHIVSAPRQGTTVVLEWSQP